jgi:hypothetical protein
MKFLRGTLKLGSFCMGGLLLAAEPQSAPPQIFARKNEIKLFVTPANTEQALAALKLNEAKAVEQMVCFFDTADGAFESQNLILRVRQKGNALGESTVKLRAIEGTTALSDIERSIQPEQDWTHESGSTLSRTVDWDTIETGLAAKVAAGKGEVRQLFNETQQNLLQARMKDFRWESLKRYGPVQARVWREDRKLAGFKEKVTIERWHLEKDGRILELLEVSAKTKADTEEQAQALAKQFFEAAKSAGLGEPSGQTKTKQVLEFFKPGR